MRDDVRDEQRPPEPGTPEYLTLVEAAKLLGFDPRTVLNYVRCGELEGRVIGGRWRFRPQKTPPDRTGAPATAADGAGAPSSTFTRTPWNRPRRLRGCRQLKLVPLPFIFPWRVFLSAAKSGCWKAPSGVGQAPYDAFRPSASWSSS